MPKLMSASTMDATAHALSNLYRKQQLGFAVVLHGGEPLLLGASRLNHFLSTLRDSLGPECSLNIQTNGILISDIILDVCADHACTLSISLDGPAHVHDRHRVGHAGQPTHTQVHKGIDKLRAHKASHSLFSGLLAVIDPDSNPAEVYHHLKSFHAPSIDFLYRDGNHSKAPAGKRSYLSTEYGLWLCQLFDIYMNDSNPPRIRLLDDITKLMLGGQGQKEGVGLTDFGILVVDTDGTISKNDTLKSSFDGADRFTETWTVLHDELCDIIATETFAHSHAVQKPTSQHCLTCAELDVCGGGMPLHRWSDDRGYDNPSVYCYDQKLFLSHVRERLASIEVAP